MVFLIDMTTGQAKRMMEDLGKNLIDSDYSQNIYISTQLDGSKSYRKCAYFEADNYIFIWKKELSTLISRKQVGDYILVPASKTQI